MAGLLLVVGGVAAGFINTVAGGGSAITIPVLVEILGDPLMANGTNRVAILLQNAVGVAAFQLGNRFLCRTNRDLALKVGHVRHHLAQDRGDDGAGGQRSAADDKPCPATIDQRFRLVVKPSQIIQQPLGQRQEGAPVSRQGKAQPASCEQDHAKLFLGALNDARQGGV